VILRTRPARAGLSLLEVLTALAIFLLSVVVISQMVDSASRTAQSAQRVTQAAILAESMMNEIAAGIQPMASVGEQLIPEAGPEWTVSVLVEPQDWSSVPVDNVNINGLNNVSVTVRWNSASGVEAEYTLSRVLLDPRIRVPAAETAAATSTTDTGGGSSGGTTGSGSGSTGGGGGAGGGASGGGGGGGAGGGTGGGGGAGGAGGQGAGGNRSGGR
jgi:Tfp pilus assembly protein PilV